MGEKAKLRVAVAMDALAQIDTYEVSTGDYYYSKHAPGKVGSGECRVCALGSLFVASVRMGIGHVREVDGRGHYFYFYREGIVPALKAAGFEHDQMVMIEAAFERWDRGMGIFSVAIRLAVDRYGRRSSSAKGRLADILENIIRNDGTFDPEDLRFGIPEAKVPEMDVVELRLGDALQVPSKARVLV